MSGIDPESAALIAKLVQEDEYLGGVFDSDSDEDTKAVQRRRRRKETNASRKASARQPRTSKSASPKVSTDEQLQSPQETGVRSHFRQGAWGADEEERFVEAMELYGRDWKKAAEHIATRSADAIRSRCQKWMIKLYIEGTPLPAKMQESGVGHTLSGQPLDESSAAFRAVADAKSYRAECKQRKKSANEEKLTHVNEVENANVGSSATAARAAHAADSDYAAPARAKRGRAPNRVQKDESTKRALQVTEYARKRPKRLRARQKAYHDSDDPGSFRMVPLRTFAEEEAPFSLVVHSNALLAADYHAHQSEMEIIGFLAGRWNAESRIVEVVDALACESISGHDADDEYTSVEMDPASEVAVRDDIRQRNLIVVGWYHSHPYFKPLPSLRDIDNQANYQSLFRDAKNDTDPFVGLIVGPYDPEMPYETSVTTWFWTQTLCNGERRAMSLTPTVQKDIILSEETVKRLVEYAAAHRGHSGAVDFRAVWRQEIVGDGESVLVSNAEKAASAWLSHVRHFPGETSLAILTALLEPFGIDSTSAKENFQRAETALALHRAAQ